jgi:murein DD-endopeptidase MepM/ murein hydrolase activator NlpD
MAQWGRGLAYSHRYKKFEKQLVSKAGVSAGNCFRALGRFLGGTLGFFDRKLTIMIVPHSNNKIVNLQTNMFAMLCGLLLVIGVVSSFFYFNKNAIKDQTQISTLRDENRQTLASLDELRDENNNLLQTAKRFQSALSQSLSLLGITQTVSASQTPVKTGDLSSLFTTEDLASGSIRETADIRQLAAYLEGAVQPIEQIGKMLETQGALFSDIPSISPLKNTSYHISMAFGQNIHPITGQWYIHRGVDLSTYRIGDPIMTTANGQVVSVNYDPTGFGNYVIIRHKHGVYTLYGHMNEFRVRKGQFVTQGDVVGTIGATGVVTGPHLHYEVHVGSDVVDPVKYIPNLKLGIRHVSVSK